MSNQDYLDQFKFTERAKKAMSLAKEEARRFNQNYISAEHLLLGIVRQGDGVAAKVLSNLGVELNQLSGAVEILIRGSNRIVLGEIDWTPRAKKVIELAVDEARLLNHHVIGTEHLLLGLVRERHSNAARTLASVGIDLETARMETIRVLSMPKTTSSPARTRAFISYSHQDKKYLERLHVHLKHYEPMGTLDVWDDTKIAAGAKWREEIKAAIRSAKVAILLISADFLASDFVAEKELPPLLAAAQDEGAIIIPVILKPCAFEDLNSANFRQLRMPDR